MVEMDGLRMRCSVRMDVGMFGIGSRRKDIDLNGCLCSSHGHEEQGRV